MEALSESERWEAKALTHDPEICFTPEQLALRSLVDHMCDIPAEDAQDVAYRV